MKLAANEDGSLNAASGLTVRRFCDNEQCRKPLTREVPASMSKLNMRSRRINTGVTTLSVSVRSADGTTIHVNGEWCHACADAGMSVLLDKVQEERSLLGAGTKKVD